MVAKLCKYCNIQMLEGFDEVERKFYEKGTKTLHTRERCEAIRNKGGDAQIYTKPAPSIDLTEINSKLDQIIALLKGQSTLEGNE